MSNFKYSAEIEMKALLTVNWQKLRVIIRDCSPWIENPMRLGTNDTINTIKRIYELNDEYTLRFRENLKNYHWGNNFKSTLKLR